MRATSRLLATVKPGRFLEPGNPTGLTGLFTHPSPRSTLIATYNATLDKLQRLPEHSVYRQSAEAITRHRLNVIETVKPEGYEEWAKRAEEKIKAKPGIVQSIGRQMSPSEVDGRRPVSKVPIVEEDDREVEWDGEAVRTTLEGVRSEDERAYQKTITQNEPSPGLDTIQWEPEPPLDAIQIQDVESQIGGGLIEEVIEVAEAELQLVNEMAESKVWEELEEKAPEGQWTYFARDQHTLPTQEPPVEKK